MLDYGFPSGVRPKITGSLTLNNGDGPRIEITQNDIAQNSIVIQTGVSMMDEFTVGAAVIGSLQITLLNYTGKFSNLDWTTSWMHVYLEYEDHRISSDVYYVVSHKERGKTITIEAYDALKVFDEHQLYELNITWPVDAAELVKKMSEFSFIGGLNITGIERAEGLMLADPGQDTMTFRTCLSHIAQCIGRFVQYRNPSNLDFGWYNLRDSFDAGTTFTHDLRTQDVKITGVKVVSYDRETVRNMGTDDMAIEVSENPFITADTIDRVSDMVAESVIGIAYRPGTFDIRGNPAIEAGDMLTINTGEESGINVLATNISYRPGQLRESISSDYYPEEDDLRITRAEYVRRVIKEELNNPNSDLSNAISGSGGGTGGLSPDEVYAMTRPKDWIQMPEPDANEIYLLMHIPEGTKSKFACSVTVPGDGAVSFSTLTGDGDIVTTETMIQSGLGGMRWSVDLNADDFGNQTSTGMRQCLVRIRAQGGSITVFQPTEAAGYVTVAGQCNFPVVEISANLPDAEELGLGTGTTFDRRLSQLVYIKLLGGGAVCPGRGAGTMYPIATLIAVRGDATERGLSNYGLYSGCTGLVAAPPIRPAEVVPSLQNTFYGCTSLASAPDIDFSKFRSIVATFNGCVNLSSAPNIHAEIATSIQGVFQGCTGLTSLPEIRADAATQLSTVFYGCTGAKTAGAIYAPAATSLTSLFQNCASLIAPPDVYAPKATALNSMWLGCASLVAGPEYDYSAVTNAASIFSGCNSLRKLYLKGWKYTITSTVIPGTLSVLELDPSVEGWAGAAITLPAMPLGHDGLVRLFQSLPKITGSYRLTYSTIVLESPLTDEEKAIATDKGWTLYPA